jgi:hypothetical protein
MPIRIEAPDGTIAEFPDGTADDTITSVMSKTFGGPKDQARPQNKTGPWEAAAAGASQGVSFGFADEIEGGLRAAGAKIMDPAGPSLGERYDEKVTAARDRLDVAAEEHPLAYYGGEIGSSLLLPGGLARLGVKSAVKAAAGQGLKATAKAGLKEGAAYGAAYGAGKSEGGLEDRAAGAIGGAALGGALGGAAPVVIEGAAAAIRPVRNAVNAAVRPEAEAGRRVAEAMDADIAVRSNTQATQGVTPQQIERNRGVNRLLNQGRAGDELRNMDVGGENTRALARSAANNSPEARDLLQNVISERFAGQSGRTVDFLRGLIPTPGNAPQTREAIHAAARQARAPLYQAAYRQGADGVVTPGLEAIAQAPVVQDAMRKAVTNIRNKAPTGQSQNLTGPNGPSLAYWDQVARELRDVQTSAFRNGENELASTVTDLRRRLLDELDAAVPSFRDARGVAAQYFRADDALEAGENFVTGNFPAHEARNALNRMSRAEQEAFREGFVSRYVQRLEETGDRRTILGRIAESPAARERIETALGPNRARELEAFLHVEQLMELPRTALGNSTTARQLVELGLAGGAGMLASGGNISDPTTWIVGALTRYGMQRGQARIDQNMARRIAEMLVSRDEAVFRRGVQQVAHGPGMAALRNLSRELAQGAGGGGAGLAGGSAMAQQETAQPQKFAALDYMMQDDDIDAAKARGDANIAGIFTEIEKLKPDYVPGQRQSTNVIDKRGEKDDGIRSKLMALLFQGGRQ